MTRRFVLLITVLAVASGAQAAPAPAQVAGEEQGVTAVKKGREHVLRFGKRAAPFYRRIAGRRIEIGCGRVAPRGGGYSSSGEGTTVVRAPKRRQTLRTFQAGKADYCLVRLRNGGDELVVMTPATDAGRIYLDELRTAGLMFVAELVEGAAGNDDDAPATTEEYVAAGDGFMVALDGPEGTPPRGKVGYWSDGSRAVLAAVTARGRRLFYETQGDVVRTNILPYLLED